MIKQLLFITTILLLTACTTTREDPPLPEGYTLDGYEVVEQSETPCRTHDECELPFDYAIRSNCPYTALCLEGNCAVVCPQHI